ncbi:MAG: TetR/AcrR family transcriptional regulator [Myxococcales bacterium]|nr:TetR/AcrR family transcriptional regulator [Myxococcales bacterium]
MTPKGEEKAQRIVEAATNLFRLYGFKRTSLDLLAAEAGVAKPTIYAYFADKDAIFRAVVESLCEELLTAAQAASQSSLPLDEKLAAMLSAKFTRSWELIHSSPHARELHDSQGRLGAETVKRADRAFLKLLVACLQDAEELDLEQAGLSVTAAAQLLVRGASGASYDATSTTMHKRLIAELVRVLIAGLSRRKLR